MEESNMQIEMLLMHDSDDNDELLRMLYDEKTYRDIIKDYELVRPPEINVSKHDKKKPANSIRVYIAKCEFKSKENEGINRKD